MRTLFFVLLLAAPVHADQLLAEISYAQPQPVTLPETYVIGVHPGTSESGRLFTQHVTEYPTIYVGTAVDIDRLNQDMCRVDTIDAYITVRSGLQMPPFGRHGFNIIWATEDPNPNDGLTAMAHVPRIHRPERSLPNSGLFGYWLTGVEHVITAEAQTLYFYGHTIPEPASFVLVLLGALLHGIQARRSVKLTHLFS